MGKAFNGIKVPSLLTTSEPGNHRHGCLLMSPWVGLHLPCFQGRNQVPLLCSTDPAAKRTASWARQGHRAGFCPGRILTGQHRLPLLRQPCHRARSPPHDRTFIQQMTLHVRFTPETRPGVWGLICWARRKLRGLICAAELQVRG